MKPFVISPGGAAPAAKPAEKVDILVVDDQPANLAALESLLDDSDFSVVKAASGAEALRCMLKADFAVVLLDVLMPVMDGFETAALIRQRPQSRHTPIIFLTAASSSDANIGRGYALGAVDYIYKPIVPEILKAKLAVFVELHRKSRELVRNDAALRGQLAELKRSEAARRESDSRYRELFTRASDAIILFDAAGERVLDANQAAEALYGYTRAELLRLRERDLLSETRLDGPYHEHRTREGRVFPAEVTRVGVTLRGKKFTMHLTRDLTERLRAEESERLREREKLQRHLIATVSHELRTPIAAIKASVETLSAPDAPEAKTRARFMKIIERQSERLGGLVEDLLTVAEFEAGKREAEPENVALREFSARLIKELAPLAARKGVTLEADLPQELALWIDPAHLERILQNLLDNAIKYNRPKGTARLEARVEDGMARVSVRDTGIGIPVEELPLIFHQFHRTATARAHAERGSGLGLYIIKAIVESNGGRIWAESGTGKGSVFHFTAPLPRSSAL